MLNEIIGTLSFLQPGLDDDFIDRLNYYHTSTFLIVIAILVSFKMLAGRPMECWVPAEYTGSWEGYSEVYCWAESTYFVPFDQRIPRDLAEREFQRVSYYQWVPFYLLITALLYYAPCIIWRVFSSKSGVVLNDIVAIAKDKGNIHPETRETNIKGMGEHLLSIFRHQFHVNTDHNSLHRVARCLNIRYYESYMISLYLFVKFLFLSNSTIQLFLINRFLQTDRSSVYGWGVLEDLMTGKGWKESGNFPRVTMCDMDIRVLGNMQKHTVQCVLVINIFTEKIFILLWIWFTVLSVINLGSLLYWFGTSILLRERKRFVERQLSLANIGWRAKDNRDKLPSFVRNWLKMDGVFVLRIITMHSSLMFTMELIHYMWLQFLKHNDAAMRIVDSAGGKNSKGDIVLNIEDVDGDGDIGPEDGGVASDGDWDHSSLPPPLPERSGSYEPAPRKTSVFVPLILPHSDRSRLPKPASSYKRASYGGNRSRTTKR